MREPKITMTLDDGYAPVQVEGVVEGYPFYFRARHDQWSFALSLDPEIHVYDIYDSSPQSFYREGMYGNSRDSAASFMPREDVVRFILQCAREFAQEQAENPIPPVNPAPLNPADE